MINRTYHFIDRIIISFFKKISVPLARVSLFTVFAWFGVLKVFGMSPANPLVANLLNSTIPFVSFDQFIIILGLYEILIGLFFILPRYERVAIFLLVPHIVVVALPLILLPEVAWVRSLVPTMEGQYIIKNMAIVALAISLATKLHPRYR